MTGKMDGDHETKVHKFTHYLFVIIAVGAGLFCGAVIAFIL